MDNRTWYQSYLEIFFINKIKIFKTKINNRLEASNKVAENLGFEWFRRENFPDYSMDYIPLIEIVKVIEEAKKKINPKYNLYP